MKRYSAIFILLVVLLVPCLPSVLGNGEECFIDVDTDPRVVNKFGSETTLIFGNLDYDGSGLGGKTVELYHQYASTEFGFPPDAPRVHIADVVTEANGDYDHDWNPDDSLANGYYWIWAVFPSGGGYDGCEGYTGVVVPNLHVIPEVPFGPLMVLASMMLALVVLKRRRHTFAESSHLV